MSVVVDSKQMMSHPYQCDRYSQDKHPVNHGGNLSHGVHCARIRVGPKTTADGKGKFV